MSGCSRWNFTGGLPETSNCYCHPGIAGGSPAYASIASMDFRLEGPATGIEMLMKRLAVTGLLALGLASPPAAALAQAERGARGRDFGELHAADAPAFAPVVLGDTLHSRQACDALPAIRNGSARASVGELCEIYEGAVVQPLRIRGECRRLDLVGPHDVPHRNAISEKVVADDAAVTAPPQCFRAHDHAALPGREFA